MATELARTLGPDELRAKGICPVKKEYLRTAVTRKLVDVVVSSVEGGAAQNVKKKSQKQQRKERYQRKAESLCFKFIRDECEFGDKCKFSHDVSRYLASRPQDLPGLCPFHHAPECPFGLLCRWASTHRNPDPLTQRYVTESTPAAPAGDGVASGSSLVVIQLPVSERIEKPGNELPRDLQLALRKNTYDFDRAAAVLASHNVDAKPPRKFANASAQPPATATAVGAVKERGPDEGSAPPSAPPVHGAQDAGSGSVPTQSAPSGTDDGAVAGVAQSAMAASASDGAVLAGGQDDGAVAAGEASGEQGAPANACPPVTADAAGGEASADEPKPKRARIDGAVSGGTMYDDRSPIPLYDISVSSHTNGDLARLRPEEKKRVDFRRKLYLAPLTTCGNLPFRRVCKGLGCDITCGEMAMAVNLLQGQPSEWALLKRHPSEDCFGVQICGAYPDAMARCCQLIDDVIDVDFVDINCGCPIDLVCSKGAGSGLLLKPKRLEQIVRVSAAVLSCPLTFKTRMAYNDRPLVAHEILPHAAAWGAQAVTLHGRTRQQRYSRSANWEYIDKVADCMPSGFPVIGNGDVFTWEDYEAHLQNEKLATCMIARGALIKPWLFTEIKEKRHWDISANERLDILKDFCRFGLEHWGSDTKGVENVRRFLLEWLSYLHRYVPVGLLEAQQTMSLRPPAYFGRSDLETLLSSPNAADWVKISEMLLGPAPPGFQFAPKHKSNAYTTESDMAREPEGEENG